MDRLLRNILLFYSLTGLYLDSSLLVTGFWSWRRWYPLLVTICSTTVFATGLVTTFIQGLDILYNRFGVNAHETADLINTLGPLTSKIIILSTLLYMLDILSIYYSIVLHSRRLVSYLTHPLYARVPSSRTSAWLGLTSIILTQVVLFFSLIYGRLPRDILHSLVILIRLFLALFCVYSHQLVYIFLSIYFMIINIQSLRRLDKDMTSTGLVSTIDRLCTNVQRFCDNVSLPLCIYFLNNLVQTSFNLSFVYFQDYSRSLFVDNILVVLTVQLSLMFVLCCLSQLLPHTFDRLYRNANKGKNPVRRHWRIQYFLLSQERSRLQPRIFRLVEVSVPTFVSLVLFSFEFGIVMFQTEHK